MLIIFIKYFLCLLLAQMLFYATGKGIFFLLKINITEFYADTFAKLFSGMIVFVVLTSLYFSKFITLNLGFLILTIFFLKEYFKNRSEYSDGQRSQRVDYRKLLVECSIVSILVFVLKYISIYHSSGIPIVTHQDYPIFVHFTDYLIETGKENISLNYIFSNELGVSPYHYFALWLNAGLSYFNLNPLLCIVLVTYSLATVILWFGIVAFIGFFKRIKPIHKVAGFFFLFLTGIIYHLFSKAELLNASVLFATNILDNCKLFPIYLFLQAALLLFLYNKYRLGMLALLCLPVAYITTAVGVLFSILTFPVIHYFMVNKRISLKPLINEPYGSIIFSAVLVYLFIGSFHLIFGRNTPTVVPGNFMDIIPALVDPSGLRTMMNIIGKTTIQFFLVYLPTLLITTFIFFRIKIKAFVTDNPFILLAPSIIFSSLLGWAFIHILPGNAVEVFTNIAVPVFWMLTIAACAYIFFNSSQFNKWQFRLGTCIMIAVIVQNIYHFYVSEFHKPQRSVKFLKEIHNAAPGLSMIGAIYVDSKYYLNRNFSWIHIQTSLGDYLAYTESRTFPISISVHEYPFSTEKRQLAMEELNLKCSPFYMYVAKQKTEGRFKSLPQSRLDFIKEYKINYLITLHDVKVDSLLLSLVEKEMVDETTGEKFLWLKEQ